MPTVKKGVLLGFAIFLSLCYIYYTQSSINVTILQHEKDRVKATIRNEVTEICSSSLRFKNSTWFTKRFKDILPFWSKNNIEVDEEALKWWLGIQRSPKENLTALIKEVFQIGVPQNIIQYVSNSKCKTCAVVGNSQILKDSKHGKEIDNHDIVIRFNKAITRGFENDVGQKTTYRMLYPESALPTLPPDNGLLLLPFKTLDLKWLRSALTDGTVKRTYINVLSHINCNISNIRILHPTFLRYCYTDWVEKHGRYPSTGIIGLLAAIHLCDEVNAYGFGASTDGAWNHYWEKPKSLDKAFRRTKVHDGDFEENLINILHNEGIIKKHQ